MLFMHTQFSVYLIVLIVIIFHLLPQSRGRLPQAELNEECNSDDEICDSPTACKDSHVYCPGWAKSGECTKNPGYMILNCPFSCNTCEMRDPVKRLDSTRCNRLSLNMSSSPAYLPGDIDRIFSEIPIMFADQYGVTVLSAAPNPWVITLDDFVSDEEINSLMKGVKPEFDTKKPPSTRADKSSNSTTNTSIGNNSSMLNASKLWTEVTTTLGGFIAKGEHKDNNSTYVWCLGECERRLKVQAILDKVEEVTRIPRGNYEAIQVERYDYGNSCNVHHDNLHWTRDYACGPRVASMSIYLSDSMDDDPGGEYVFTELNLVVKPKKRRALLFTNNKDSAPAESDMRSRHSGLPQYAGTKYMANIFMHLYNFKIPNAMGCTPICGDNFL